MKQVLIVFFLFHPFLAIAATDSLAPATYVHTKVELPAPYLTGEIIAQFAHDREEAFLSFRTLSIKIGSQKIEVPKHILRFFTGPQPGSLQFFVGPPTDRDIKTPDYFCVSFRYFSRSYNGIDSPENHLNGSIYIKNGVLQGIAKWEKRPEGGANAEFYDTDLKAVRSLP